MRTPREKAPITNLTDRRVISTHVRARARTLSFPVFRMRIKNRSGTIMINNASVNFVFLMTDPLVPFTYVSPFASHVTDVRLFVPHAFASCAGANACVSARRSFGGSAGPEVGRPCGTAISRNLVGESERETPAACVSARVIASNCAARFSANDSCEMLNHFSEHSTRSPRSYSVTLIETGSI